MMIRKDKVKFADGTIKTHIRVVKGYRPAPNTPPKQVTIKTFGYLEDQTDLDTFWKEVNEVNDTTLTGHQRNTSIREIDYSRKNNHNTNIEVNFGYRFIESVLEELELKEYFDNLQYRCKYDLYDVLSFLVYQRILNPSSKRTNVKEIDKFYNKKYDFELYDVYRALDIFSDESLGIQTHINKRIKKIIGRDSSYAFYDVTNYYFEKDFNGGPGSLLFKGVSKEHQLTPIVQFGLFMDSNNIPIAYKAYPDNTSDSLTLRPAMTDIKKDFGLGRLIVVADKGLNSSANIDFICNNGDGYVVSQVLKGPKGTRYHEKLFNPEGYEGTEEFKYKVFEEEYETNINSKKKVTRRRKVLLYWSQEDARYAKAKRQQKILKAQHDLTNNVYSTEHANFKQNGYIVTQYLNKETGEIADKEVKAINYEKISEEEKFDGYFCIITSELDYDYKKILTVYRNLSKIEESFRITKSDLETRPMYVTTNKHIEGHLLTCFISLIVLRMMQVKMGENKITADRIKKVLNKCKCKIANQIDIDISYIGGVYEYKEGKYNTLIIDKNEDEIRNDFIKISSSFNVDFDRETMKRTEFNKMMKKIKYKIKKV